MSNPTNYLYVGHEAKNNKFRIFLLKETATGMKPVLSYSKDIGLFFPYCTAEPVFKAGCHVVVTWEGYGKIAAMKEA